MFKKLGHNIRGITLFHDEGAIFPDEFIVDNVLDYSKIVHDILGRTNLKLITVRDIIDDFTIDFRKLLELEYLSYMGDSLLYGIKITKLETSNIPKSLSGIRILTLDNIFENATVFNEPNAIEKLALINYDIELTQSYKYLYLYRSVVKSISNDKPIYIKHLVLNSTQILQNRTIYVEHLELSHEDQYCPNLITKILQFG